MNLPADPLTATSGLPLHPTLREAVRAPRRRRPTGEPPPLPNHHQTSGVGRLLDPILRLYLSPRFAAELDEHIHTEFPRLRDYLHGVTAA